MALDRLPIPRIPVTVITARADKSADPEEQKVWLEGSSDPVHVVLDGDTRSTRTTRQASRPRS
jgi:hypothetical protein